MTASGRSWPANDRDSGSHSLARFGKIPNRNTDDDKQDTPLLQTTAAFPATGRARVFGGLPEARWARRRRKRRLRGSRRPRSAAGPDDDPRAQCHAAVEVFDILIEQANAARGDELADGRGLIGAVDAVERLAEIERAGAQRIAGPARHHPRQIGLAIDHLVG